MSNPFFGIITSDLKLLFKQGIEEVITSCSRPVRLIYGITSWTDCPNCTFSPLTGTSANIYTVGGPVPFPQGARCPYCNGKGRVGVETTENMRMDVIWNYKDFIALGTNELPLKVQTAGGAIQTLTLLIGYVDKIKRAKEIIINTDIEPYEIHKFERFGEPTPLGLGADDFVLTTWTRVQ